LAHYHYRISIITTKSLSAFIRFPEPYLTGFLLVSLRHTDTLIFVHGKTRKARLETQGMSAWDSNPRIDGVVKQH